MANTYPTDEELEFERDLESADPKQIVRDLVEARLEYDFTHNERPTDRPRSKEEVWRRNRFLFSGVKPNEQIVALSRDEWRWEYVKWFNEHTWRHPPIRRYTEDGTAVPQGSTPTCRELSWADAKTLL